jgi:hypothetical protein
MADSVRVLQSVAFFQHLLFPNIPSLHRINPQNIEKQTDFLDVYKNQRIGERRESG